MLSTGIASAMKSLFIKLKFIWEYSVGKKSLSTPFLSFTRSLVMSFSHLTYISTLTETMKKAQLVQKPPNYYYYFLNILFI